jgi:hypothetical protein
MDKRAALMQRIAAATSLQEQTALVRQLDDYDRASVQAHQASRQLGFADETIAQTLTPVHVAQQHTAATDWLGDVDTSGGQDWHADMAGQASLWFQRTSAAVKADPGEFAEQARGTARILAGRYGENAGSARSAFTRQAALLWKGSNPRLAASGIPQIDQLIDPNNQPQATPYPAEVFDNFAPPVHPVNQGIEDESGQGWPSTQAPMIQTLEQMNGSGSGFGSGPEKPDEHDLGDDVDGPNSYSEVPLGQPGQISTGQVEASRRTACLHQAAQRMTQPDRDGFQYPIQMTADADGGAGWDVDNFATPHHAKCGADHERDEPCVSRGTKQGAATCSKCHHPAHGDGKCSSSGCTCHGVSSVTAAAEPHRLSPAIAYQYNLDDYREQQRTAGRRTAADDDSRPVSDTPGGPVGDTDHDYWDTGEIEDRDAHEGSLHEAGASSMRPHPNAVRGFGRMDALEGKPPHSPETYQQVFRDTSGKLHGHYMAGYNSVAEEMGQLGQKHESSFGRGLDFSRQAASGLVQVQEVVDANNKPDAQNDELPQATMFPWTMDEGDGQSLPGPEAAPRDVKRIAEAALTGDTASLRTWADQFTAPHGTTDDTYPVANSPDTTPQPATGPAAAGARDGARDRAAGNRPTFSDASSKASEYVKAYSEAYSRPSQPAGGDAPYSMGGDSGQAENSQEAQQLAEMNKAARKRAGASGAEDHFGEPYDMSRWEDPDELGGKYKSKRRYEDDPAEIMGDHEGYPEYKPAAPSHLSKLRLTASRAFVPPEALPDRSFRRGYVIGRRYSGESVPPLGSPAFESGLYAGITDSTRTGQDKFVAAHRRLARRGRPELMERISAHQEFSYRKAREDPSIVVRGSYVQAATSSDLETTAPGTSADPMGSTPLNGPGTPPPMQGGTDPARSGGPSPYQGAEPKGKGPVAPDPIMGDQQPEPPPTGEVMGGEGYSGYLNPDAYQGNPQGGPKRQAFRAKIQANLAAAGRR